MNSHRDSFDVIIAGGGPAGSSAAIHLARRGVRVLLVEQKKFPRAKLCGEFISPECQKHFDNLGVTAAISASQPAALTETVFYSAGGHNITVPSSWFGSSAALGLSRAVMDNVLLRRAQACGVTVLEGATITEPLKHDTQISGVKLKQNGREHEYLAPLTIDATGRAHPRQKTHRPGTKVKTKTDRFQSAPAQHTRRAQRVRDLLLPRRLRRPEHRRRRHQQSLLHHLRRTSEASLFKPGHRHARNGDEEPARRLHTRRGATRFRVAERLVGTLRTATTESSQRLAHHRRLGSFHRSFHRQWHADGAREW